MRKRRTKAEKEQTLNKILELRIAGKSDMQIRQELGLNYRNYEKYNVMLKDKFTNEMLSEREEHFAFHVQTTIEAINRLRQTFLEQMNNPKASPTAKILAAEKEMNALIHSLRLRYEGDTWMRTLKSNNLQKVLPVSGNVNVI
jgi:DNA replicative helicase MCM subunit Mcm2 (Cdc46/Mcm family)